MKFHLVKCYRSSDNDDLLMGCIKTENHVVLGGSMVDSAHFELDDERYNGMLKEEVQQ